MNSLEEKARGDVQELHCCYHDDGLALCCRLLHLTRLLPDLLCPETCSGKQFNWPIHFIFKIIIAPLNITFIEILECCPRIPCFQTNEVKNKVPKL